MVSLYRWAQYNFPLSLIFLFLLIFLFPLPPSHSLALSLPPLTAATQYSSNGAVGGRGLEESEEYVDEGGKLQFDDQYQEGYECE